MSFLNCVSNKAENARKVTHTHTSLLLPTGLGWNRVKSPQMETCGEEDVETSYFPHSAFFLTDDGGMLVAIGCWGEETRCFYIQAQCCVIRLGTSSYLKE